MVDASEAGQVIAIECSINGVQDIATNNTTRQAWKMLLLAQFDIKKALNGLRKNLTTLQLLDTIENIMEQFKSSKAPAHMDLSQEEPYCAYSPDFCLGTACLCCFLLLRQSSVHSAFHSDALRPISVSRQQVKRYTRDKPGIMNIYAILNGCHCASIGNS